MRVPVYERKQGLAPLPGVQVSPAYSPSDNGATTAGIAKNLATRLQKIHEDTEDARTLELLNKFKAESQEYHENPDKGIYNTRLGYHAQGIYKEADEWLRRKGEDYARDLGTRAKYVFRQKAEEYIQQRGLQNSRFEADQMKKYQAEQSDAAIKNAIIYAEQNWDNPDAITQARKDIDMALELKMRGSGREAFKNANAEIENQLGIARLRQAYTKDPLLALQMLDDEDIHLKPETAAQLRQNLTQKTEVYELQAIAQTYSKNYTPQNAVAASNDLIRRYGADKGQKAFAALSRIWSIGETQKNAREKNTLEAQQKNEEGILIRLLDPSKSQPIEKQIISLMNSKSIRPDAARGFLNFLKSAEKKKQEEKKDELENLLWYYAQHGGYVSQDTLDKLVLGGHIDKSYANYLSNDKATRDKAISEYNAKAQKRAREDFEKGLDIIINNGGIIPHEQVNELLQNDRISQTFANKLWKHEDSYNAEQEKLQAAQAKELSKTEKVQLQESLDASAKSLSVAYPTGQSGEGLKLINNLDMPLEDRKFLRERYLQYVHDQETAQKDNDNLFKRQYDMYLDNIRAGVMAGDFSREEIEQLRDNLERADYNELIGILDKQEKAAKEADKKFRSDKNYETAQDLAKRFPLGNEKDAYDEIRQTYGREDAKEIISNYDRLIQEQRTAQQNDEKAKKEQQKQNYRTLNQNYWQKLSPVPNSELERMRGADELTDEQLKRAYEMNALISTRAGIEKMLMQDSTLDFIHKSRQEQEQIIMLHMGTDENKRKENVSFLFKKVLDDTATDEMFDWYYVHGGIAADDKENLKSYNAKFEREQKAILNNTARKLITEIKKVGIRNKSSDYENMALTDFYRITSTLDLHAKNFNEAVENIYKTVLANALGAYGDTISKTEYWGLRTTPAEQRRQKGLQSAEQFTLPQSNPQLYYEPFEGDSIMLNSEGKVSEWSNVVEVPPPPPEEPKENNSVINIRRAPFNPQNYGADNPALQRLTSADNYNYTQPDPSVLQGVINVGKSIIEGVARRTSEFDPTPTKLRNGRGHLAEDYGVPVGTPIRTLNLGTTWKVKRTGEDSKAGKFVAVETITPKGDTLEVLSAHMSSIDIKPGDVIMSGDVVGKSGNTGNSTGPHVHVKTTLNGKVVPPSSIDVGQPAPQTPQPIVPPIQSSDAEINNALMSIFFGSNNLSNDIFINIPYGGY